MSLFSRARFNSGLRKLAQTTGRDVFLEAAHNAANALTSGRPLVLDDEPEAIFQAIMQLVGTSPQSLKPEERRAIVNALERCVWSMRKHRHTSPAEQKRRIERAHRILEEMRFASFH